VKSVKDECLSKLILFGEPSLRRALQNYLVHYHEERNHQGKENVLLFLPLNQPPRKTQELVRCRDRLGGLLRYYHREAAQTLGASAEHHPSDAVSMSLRLPQTPAAFPLYGQCQLAL